MSGFVVYPAVDLHRGKVVRLRQGNLADRTDYALQPAEAAARWLSAGAEWLHVVNLDGAFGLEDAENLAALRSIVALGGRVQFGGGVRSMEKIAFLLDLGVERVILGTVAAKEPQFVAKALARFGAEKIVVGIDARDGVVRVGGWQESSGLSPKDLGARLAGFGLKRVVFTNIARDGLGAGLDVEGARRLAEVTGLEVIASGGVRGLEDVCRARNAELGGVVIGRALYDGNLDLEEALQC